MVTALNAIAIAAAVVGAVVLLLYFLGAGSRNGERGRDVGDGDDTH